MGMPILHRHRNVRLDRGIAVASGDLFKGFPVRFSMKNMQHVKVLEKFESGSCFFRILMSRSLTPEQRADILMNGTVRV